jgi:hypothetical protein
MNQDRPPPPKRAMNAVLWTIQALWGVFLIITGFGKVDTHRACLNRRLPRT